MIVFICNNMCPCSCSATIHGDRHRIASQKKTFLFICAFYFYHLWHFCTQFKKSGPVIKGSRRAKIKTNKTK